MDSFRTYLDLNMCYSFGVWILIVIGALLIVQFYGFITRGKKINEFLHINMVLIFIAVVGAHSW